MKKPAREQIIAALRCTAGEDHPGTTCNGCPYYIIENLTEEQKSRIDASGDAWESCDADQVALDAADLLESEVTDHAE